MRRSTRIWACIVIVCATMLRPTSGHCATREEGTTLLKEGADTMSLPILERALRVWRAEAASPDRDGSGHYRLARTLETMAVYYADRDEEDEAVRLLQEGLAAAQVAVQRLSTSSPYHTALGELYGLLAAHSGVIGRMRYGRSAAAAFARALELDPRNALAHVGAGIGKLETPPMFGGSPDGAIDEFRRARTLDPTCEEAWIWEGIARRRQGAVADARAAFNAALALNPRSDHARRELARLDEDYR